MSQSRLLFNQRVPTPKGPKSLAATQFPTPTRTPISPSPGFFQTSQSSPDCTVIATPSPPSSRTKNGVNGVVGLGISVPDSMTEGRWKTPAPVHVPSPMDDFAYDTDDFGAALLNSSMADSIPKPTTQIPYLDSSISLSIPSNFQRPVEPLANPAPSRSLVSASAQTKATTQSTDAPLPDATGGVPFTRTRMIDNNVPRSKLLCVPKSNPVTTAPFKPQPRQRRATEPSQESRLPPATHAAPVPQPSSPAHAPQQPAAPSSSSSLTTPTSTSTATITTPPTPLSPTESLQLQLETLQSENRILKRRFEDLEAENEDRKRRMCGFGDMLGALMPEDCYELRWWDPNRMALRGTVDGGRVVYS